MSLQDADITDLLAQVHSIAVVGVTNRPTTPGYDVLSYQQSQGYDVIPVNQLHTSILGRPSVATVGDITAPVDLVNVFVEGEPLSEAVDAAIAKQAKAIWFQPGINDESAEKRARSAGLQVINNKCFEREHRRLMADRPM